MDTTTFEKDIKVFYVPAETFPDGIEAAYKKLHSILPQLKERRFFGLSRMENGVIAYKAAAEILNPEEQDKTKLDTEVISKGKYIYRTIHDFMEDLPAIGNTFEELLEEPGIDLNAYCVEWYVNKDVKCMVKLKE